MVDGSVSTFCDVAEFSMVDGSVLTFCEVAEFSMVDIGVVCWRLRRRQGAQNKGAKEFGRARGVNWVLAQKSAQKPL